MNQDMNETQTLQNIRVLYADDVAANRRYLKALLEKIGLHTDVAEDGTSALSQWEVERQPLVLLDVHMPGLDGPEVARRIRLLQKTAEDVIILGITADMNESLREALKMAGMDDCMEKPTDSQALLDALEPWVGTANGAQQSEDQHQAILYEDSELLELLMRELPNDVAALEEAFKKQDLSKARAIAHQLSGVAALYRLLRLREAVMQIESHLNIGAPMTEDLLEPVANALAEDLVEIQASAMP